MQPASSSHQKAAASERYVSGGGKGGRQCRCQLPMPVSASAASARASGRPVLAAQRQVAYACKVQGAGVGCGGEGPPVLGSLLGMLRTYRVTDW